MLLASLIDVVPGLMVWTVVTFAIAFYVLKRVAFGRIQGIIDARRDRIREALDEADKARQEARELRELTKREREEAKATASRSSRRADVRQNPLRAGAPAGGRRPPRALGEKPEELGGRDPAHAGGDSPRRRRADADGGREGDRQGARTPRTSAA